MKRNRLAALLGLVGILTSSAALAGSGAGAINLTFPIGARYNAMGEAGVALAQDATASWWNPGGLAFASARPESRDLQIMQTPLAEGLADDIALYWAGFAGGLGSSGSVGFYINYLDMGEQIATDDSGAEIGTFSSNMFAVGAAYGLRLSPNLGIGLGVKYFRDKLADDRSLRDRTGGSGDSFGVDLGVLWKLPFLRANLGAMVANLGPDITHVDSDQSDPMPRKLHVGAAYSVFATEAMGLLTVADFQVPLYDFDEGADSYGLGLEMDQEEWGLGLEWNYVQSLFIRFGYTSATYGDIQDTTYGFGIDLDRWTGQAINFDYASVPQAEGLDRVNRFSLGYRF
ncbi:MAG: PorV/PorQ family protein [Candidatus Krumholzibacteriia bacterium]